MTRGAPQRPEDETRLGATIEDDGVRFAVWAPSAEHVEVEANEGEIWVSRSLNRGADGLHAGFVPGLSAGARYRYRLDGGEAYPDPASRFQAEGVHGPSEVIDAGTFPWTDQDWPGLHDNALIIYELHVGVYTSAGTFQALADELPELARLGVTAIELMPVAQFGGTRNWGYDGADWWAPAGVYGRPDDLRRLVDDAHRAGLGVILDVVYNHFGPDGAYWGLFSKDYFTDRHQTPWGDAINYDGPNTRWVRELAIQSACHWIREYHMDGLRLDATHAIIDDGPLHLIAELGERVRAAAKPRPLILIAEDERNDVRVIRPRAEGGLGLSAVWADDAHHAIRVALTGEREGYYAAYSGATQEIARVIREGFLYQGQVAPTTGEPRGTQVTDESAAAFVFCIQNHDQVGNRPFGDRLHHRIDAGRYAVAATLLLFAPETPLLFMGQEFAASAPFLFFTDFGDELGRRLTEGRRAEFAGFPAFSDAAARDFIPDPQLAATFEASRLDLGERRANAGVYALHRALIALRRNDPVLATAGRLSTAADAAGPHMVIARRWTNDGQRVLIANFGAATELLASAAPVIEALADDRWSLLLSTAARRLGGGGTRARVRRRGEDTRLTIPARSAAIFAVEKT